ncbi:MAG: cobalamin-binding protein [Candidatus Bathyarchaeota archaeon]|nr:cobalamin-binding protein [Candidatus Bathyarchaeota archaeon]MDH5532082.1 cobalamin-binding protein [Candidatus Bathyarchaeota archaeon]MDH5712677.1 cobalamin-binding protein [Candidatus Bathyarchaeota archaeon]
MKSNYVVYIATAIAIISIISAVYVYAHYEGQNADLHSTVSVLQSDIVNLQSELYKYRNLTLVDDYGYVLNLTSYPDRIVSLAPSNTEILFAIGADDKVVGVTDYCNYPYNFSAWIEAGNLTSVGEYWTPNIEAIVALEPDLIFAAFAQEEVVNTLRGMGYKVFVLAPDNIDDILKNIILAGRATNKDIEAALLVNNLRLRIDAVVNKVADAPSKPKVYYEIWYDPLWSVGSESWEHELIEKAGGINIFADQTIDYFMPNSEAIIECNPDVIIFPLGHGVGQPFWISFDQVKARPGWEAISAVQNDRLCTIDADIVSRSGPRIVDALETLAELVHPELF